MKWYASERLSSTLCGLILTALATTASAAKPFPPAMSDATARTEVLTGSSASRIEISASRPEFSDTLAGISITTPRKADTTSRYDRHVERYRYRWSRLIPNQHIIQYAGSIGLVSFGTGWHYGHDDDWETELLLGIVPRYHADLAPAPQQTLYGRTAHRRNFHQLHLRRGILGPRTFALHQGLLRLCHESPGQHLLRPAA